MNDKVSYIGNVYKAIQAHTAQKGWELGVAETLWQLIDENEVSH